MPRKRMRGESAFLTAITWFSPNLLANHIAQHHQALFGTTVFCFMQVEIHQAMEHAHGWVALQLAIDV